jgi:ABC-2 type transport system permease protein
MLRERTGGTLERLMSMPVGRLDLLGGYAVAFGAMAVIQTAGLSALALGGLGLDVARPAIVIVALAVANALLGMALGLFVSAFASSEFQAVQFMPALVLPQFLLCGLFVARDHMAGWLEAISWALPLTYAYDAIARATSPGALGGRFAVDVIVVVAVTLGVLVLGAATMRRRSP